jgi:hypothetical protein
VSSKLEKVNLWLTLVSNLGIVAGFVLIAFQLQQNTQALQVQASAIVASATVTAESAFMGENVAEAYAIAEKTPRDLTDAQMLQVNGYLNTSFVSIQQTYLNYQTGLALEQDWLQSKSYAVQQLSWPVGRAYWSATKKYYIPEFVSEIDEALLKTPGVLDTNYLGDLKEALLKELDSQE